MRWQETGHWLATSPLVGITLTVSAYWLGRRVYDRTGRHPLAQPVLIAIVLVGAVLVSFHVSYADYLNGARFVGFWLGPATVALALPLHREWERVRRSTLPVLAGVVLGTLVSVSTAIVVTDRLGGSPQLQATVAPKAATTPVSIAVSAQIGGIASLTAVVTIIAGITGAVFAPWVLTRAGVRNEEARGIAMGCSAHGIGTSRALVESPTEGAFSGLAMALTALATSLVVPWLVHLL